eukprot:gene5861-6152_t
MLPDKIGEWHFDKRALQHPISRNMSEPFPKATDALPCWEKYAENGEMVKAGSCDEAPKHYLATPEAALDCVKECEHLTVINQTKTSA